MPYKAKSYSVNEVFSYANIGVVFEFYSSKDINFIIEDLSRISAKNVIVTNDEKYTPSFTNALLIKEYEGKKPRYQFHLDLQQYHSMLPIVQEVNKWLKESAETTYDTLMKVSLSFNHHGLQTLQSISGMNPTKLILKFNENYVYDRFPEQKNSPYAFSIKHAAPTKSFVNEAEITKCINDLVLLPQNSYYGINFTNYTTGILEFNYIGGKNYFDKLNEINELIEYYIIKTYQSLNEDEYYFYEINEIKKLTKDFEVIQLAYFDPNIFLREFKDIKVFMDLKTSEQLVKSIWAQIRDPLFETIIRGNFRKGQFNYDSASGRYQIKDAKIFDANIKNFDFVKCDLTGVFESCHFIGCNIKRTRITDSKLLKTNEVTESYLTRITANLSNKISNSTIINNEEVLNCEIKDSVIKFASLGKAVNLDEDTVLIYKPDHGPTINQGVVVDQIRDYRWIKSLTMRHDKGFENAYDRKKYMKKNDF